MTTGYWYAYLLWREIIINHFAEEEPREIFLLHFVYSIIGSKGMDMKTATIFLSLILCGSLFAQNVAQKPLGSVLDQNGKLKPGVNGSFNAQGFEILNGKNGEPVFRKTNTSSITQTATWSALGSALNGDVRAIAVSGSDVYAGGFFTTAGGSSANYIAKWNGSSWSALGAGMNNWVMAIAVSGSDVYAGGYFTTADGNSANHIAKWNGSSWSALGIGTDDIVIAITVSGGNLLVGGWFIAAGGITVNGIARWDGGNWFAMGAGMNSSVFAIAVSGGDVYAGGAFTTADGNAANYIAKWNGSSWAALGTGMNNFVRTIAVSGSDVYAGGLFTTADGGSATYIAKWSGSAWSTLGSGMNNNVYAMTVSGSDVYVAGAFTTAGGNGAIHMAKWSGSSWSAFSGGTDQQIFASAVSTSTGSMIVGGSFSALYGSGSTSGSHIASFTDSDNPLPVELTDLSATIDESSVRLNWQTASETNSYGFEIERNTMVPSHSERQNWERVGFVDAAGTSSSPRKYAYTDRALAPGRYSYHIKQIDKGGSFKYTQTAEVEVGSAPKAFTLSQNYPNPFNPSTTIAFTLPQDGKALLKVYDLTGRDVVTLFDAEAKAGQTLRVRFNASGLSTGVYFVRLTFGGKQLQQKIALLK